MRLYKYLIYLYLIFIISSAYSQTYNYEIFGVENGLSQSQALSVIQSKSGHLWIGTNGGGVNIFDGKEFKYLTIEDGLADNVVFSISEDSNIGFFL